VHIVGFIIRIYHDAQSSECQAHLIVGSSYTWVNMLLQVGGEKL